MSGDHSATNTLNMAWEATASCFSDNPIASPVVPCPDQSGSSGGKGWTVAEVKTIISKTDPKVIEEICNGKIKIITFDTAYDKWKYDDGREEEDELKGLLGNTIRDKKEIRIRNSMTSQEAASTLFHEMGHMTRKAPSTQEGYLQEEIDVRVETEEFRIRQGMASTAKGYRTPAGKVDRAFIENQIKNSTHYNPKGRKRIGRRYVGEAIPSGWCPP
ncbi:hypothetical protein [Archangium sp.]|uniref:hypothetical protein n=1 Tax=Archangium sp. TaxID=1872627 RepID=UPI002D3665D7|nr:hypothetical protein [Archangium sp.]HYO53140.1 hypothetical protein [Archangium sp.]